MSGSINEAEGTRPGCVPSAFSVWGGRLLALLGGLTVLYAMLAALDGVGELSGDKPPPDAAGLTLDENFNIQAGDYLVQSLLIEGPAFATPAGARRVFGDPRYNPDHPPLGRFWIGAWHELLRPQLSTRNPDPAIRYTVIAARCGSVVAYLLTLAVVGRCAGRWYGPRAEWVAAISLLLMPRVFAHAHLAALETCVGLMFAGTVLYVADRWSLPFVATGNIRSVSPSSPMLAASATPRWSAVVLAGVLFGLTLLTKIQAVLLPVPIGLWCLWYFRRRAIPMLLVFGLVGLAVFFVGWPWLWLDPVAHLREYFGSKAQRPTLYCYYLGQRFADVDVPWHYPFVMFLTTVPVGLLALGLWGVFAPASRAASSRGHVNAAHPPRQIDPHTVLCGGVLLFVLAFFALPGITVYDGERLFLVVYPLLAVLIGRAASWGRTPVLPVPVAVAVPEGPDQTPARQSGDKQDQSPGLQQDRQDRSPTPRQDGQHWSATPRWPACLTTAMLVLGCGEGLWATVQLHPCQLSYYNWLVGGLAGANRLGFEPTYWRDSFTRQFLVDVAAAVPKGSTLYVAPVLHPANRVDLPLLSPILQEHELSFDSYDDNDPSQRDMRYVLVFRRHADPWSSLEPAPVIGQLLCEVRREGVQLAALYDLRPE